MVISLRVNFDLRIFLHFLLVYYNNMCIKNFQLAEYFSLKFELLFGNDIADNFYFINKIQIVLLARTWQIFLFYYLN